MRITQTARISAKKLKSYRLKTVFLVVPIAVLLACGVFLTSLTQNVQSATEQSIFGTIEDQSKMISLEKQSALNTGGGRFRLISEDNLYTESDLETVKAITGVANASLLTSVPLGEITTTNLIGETPITFGQVTSIPSGMAASYTDDSFTYTPGGEVPIVISANQLVDRTEDWQGKDEITTTLSRPQVRSGSAGRVEVGGATSFGPNKATQLSFNKQELIGKTFTARYGELSKEQTFTVNPTSEGITFKKRTADELAKLETSRKESLSKYWDYAKLSAPLEVTFKVVGVLEGDNQAGTNYIPESAASYLMQRLIDKQLAARNAAAIPLADLNQTYMGTTYDGVQLGQGASFGGRPIRVSGSAAAGGPRGGAIALATGADETSTSYLVPGLIIETKRETAEAGNPFSSGDVVGVLSNSKIYDTAARTSATMLVQVTSVQDRTSVVTALNSKGYTYQDAVKLGVLGDLKGRLQLATSIFTVLFIVVVGVVLALSLSRFISESRREIAVFRALGARSGQIRQLVLGQSLIASLAAGVAGISLGLASIVVISPLLSSWFNGVVNSTLRETYPTVREVQSGVFRLIDWQSIGLYAGILLLVTLVVSVAMSAVASNVKPAEALKQA